MGSGRSQEACDENMTQAVQFLREHRVAAACDAFDEAVRRSPHADFATTFGTLASKRARAASATPSPFKNANTSGSSAQSANSLVTQIPVGDERIIVRRASLGTKAIERQLLTPPSGGAEFVTAERPVASASPSPTKEAFSAPPSVEPSEADAFSATWAQRTNPFLPPPHSSGVHHHHHNHHERHDDNQSGSSAGSRLPSPPSPLGRRGRQPPSSSVPGSPQMAVRDPAVADRPNELSDCDADDDHLDRIPSDAGLRTSNISVAFVRESSMAVAAADDEPPATARSVQATHQEAPAADAADARQSKRAAMRLRSIGPVDEIELVPSVISPIKKTAGHSHSAGGTAKFFDNAFGDLPEYDDSELLTSDLVAVSGTMPMNPSSVSEDELLSMAKGMGLRLRIAEALRVGGETQLAEAELLVLRGYSRRLLDIHDHSGPRPSPALWELRRVFTFSCVELARLIMLQLGDPFVDDPMCRSVVASLSPCMRERDRRELELDGFDRHEEEEVAGGHRDLDANGDGDRAASASDASDDADGSSDADGAPPIFAVGRSPLSRAGDDVPERFTPELHSATRANLLRVGAYHSRVAQQAVQRYWGERSPQAVIVHVLEADVLAAARVYGRAVMALQRAIGIGVALYGCRSWDGERAARAKLTLLKKKSATPEPVVMTNVTDGSTAVSTGRSQPHGGAAESAVVVTTRPRSA